jgi:hypothetical protein
MLFKKEGKCIFYFRKIFIQCGQYYFKFLKPNWVDSQFSYKTLNLSYSLLHNKAPQNVVV